MEEGGGRGILGEGEVGHSGGGEGGWHSAQFYWEIGGLCQTTAPEQKECRKNLENLSSIPFSCQFSPRKYLLTNYGWREIFPPQISYSGWEKWEMFNSLN